VKRPLSNGEVDMKKIVWIALILSILFFIHVAHAQFGKGRSPKFYSDTLITEKSQKFEMPKMGKQAPFTKLASNEEDDDDDDDNNGNSDNDDEE
jgi:hypothetical protein